MLMNERLLVAHLCEIYPAGTRVELVRMDDVHTKTKGAHRNDRESDEANPEPTSEGRENRPLLQSF